MTAVSAPVSITHNAQDNIHTDGDVILIPFLGSGDLKTYISFQILI